MHNYDLKKTRVFLIRHGQTEYNRSGRIAGHIDCDLNDIGTSQAKSTGLRLKDIPFDAFYSSDLKRCIQTSHGILNQLEYPINIKHVFELREKYMAELEGLTTQEGVELAEKQARKLESFGESDDSFRERVEKGVELVLKHGQHFRNVLVVTHGGFIRQLLECQGKEAGVHFIYIKNTSVTIIDYEKENLGGPADVIVMGDCDHLNPKSEFYVDGNNEEALHEEDQSYAQSYQKNHHAGNGYNRNYGYGYGTSNSIKKDHSNDNYDNYNVNDNQHNAQRYSSKSQPNHDHGNLPKHKYKEDKRESHRDRYRSQVIGNQNYRERNNHKENYRNQAYDDTPNKRDDYSSDNNARGGSNSQTHSRNEYNDKRYTESGYDSRRDTRQYYSTERNSTRRRYGDTENDYYGSGNYDNHQKHKSSNGNN